ncbi:hypothetical protein I6A60_15835 [Frankia sp. AgB1.9]|nr:MULTISPECIES: hypothetical protein [unclassified Frankia]MBL7492638.1 hypothetical protein [Frankia sp. AgW1.1]MBL7549341.1 hypothetical protein [Frankia sp. AgB1.9]MBL7619192.1 hypothetical protein [Frankia sp. AgB1.8]
MTRGPDELSTAPDQVADLHQHDEARGGDAGQQPDARAMTTPAGRSQDP